jgi:hypothetical protein
VIRVRKQVSIMVKRKENHGMGERGGRNIEMVTGTVVFRATVVGN